MVLGEPRVRRLFHCFFKVLNVKNASDVKNFVSFATPQWHSFIQSSPRSGSSRLLPVVVPDLYSKTTLAMISCPIPIL